MSRIKNIVMCIVILFSNVCSLIPVNVYAEAQDVSSNNITVFNDRDIDGQYYFYENGIKKIVYCYEHDKKQPSVDGTSGYTKYDFFSSAASNPSGQVTKEMVATALYLGYPSNATGLIQKWGISSDRANYLTQQTIWQFVRGEYLPYLQDTSYDNGLIFYSQNSGSPYFNFHGDKGSVQLSGEYTLIKEGSNYKSSLVNISGDYTGEFWFNNLPPDVKVYDASTNEELASGLKTGMNIYFVSNTPLKQLSLTYSYETTSVYYLKANNTSNQELVGLDKNIVNGTILLSTESEQTVSYTVTKTWDDRDNVDGIRPESIIVKLKANDTFYGDSIQLNKENNWTYTWNELPVKNNGKDVQYSVEEVNVPSGYEVSYETNSSKSVITNTHKVETTEVSGQKIWNDKEDQDGKRPGSITVNLLANGRQVQSKEVSATDGWKYEFGDLAKYENGQEITYTVTEDQVPGYNTEIKGFDIINSYTPGKTSVSVTKAWEDSNDQDGLRPNSVKVQLYANGEKIEEAVELNEGNTWRTTWNDLPEKANGETIVYTVKEVSQVPGYTSQVDDSDLGNVKITNTHTPERIKVSGQKTWNDKEDQDGKRPGSITVNLLANGRQVQSKEVSATDGWKYEFGDLAKYENGQEITYTVTEDQVLGYNTEIKGFDIINSYTPGKTSVSVTKVWEDSNDQDGLRPNSVKVQLYANGEKIEEAVELNEGNTWRTTWNDLPEKANGETIVYTVKEVSQVPGYTSQVDDSDLGNVKITNTHTPERIKVSGQKTWNDKEDQDGKRPGSITVNLLANGRQVQSKEVSATDGWKYEFGDLAKYENGQEITYTVTEDQVPGYNTEIKGFDIINSYTPGKTSVSVTKAWEDSNDQDGLRPNSVKVQLYANGEKIEEAVELSEGNTWRTTWNDLPEKANGETIVYTVKEVSQVPGYTSQVDDSDLGNVKITNTHIPERIKVSGQKTWNDKEDQDGKRPGSITVNLLANGRQVQSKEVSATDGWKYEFGDLAKYENGQEITYTVTEDQVPGYNTEIKGFDIINSYTPGKTSVSVTKAWEDSNDQDGLRPNSVKVQLYANGEKIEEAVELSEGNTWRTTWNDLPEKANGETIVYTVKEVSQVPGYTSQVDDSDLGNVKITNTHTPERIKVSGQKTWNDKEDQDGKRPGSITVNLLANGRQVQSKEVSATDGWKYEFGDLAKYENGQEITYTVTEDQVPGYNTEIKGFDIINSYTPGKTSVSVTKAWEDSNDQDGLRPNSVKVQLYANGEKIEEAVELSEGNTWRTTWNDLPEKANGETIVYTVKEVSQVPGYTSQVDDSDLGNVKITNTHTPERIKVSGQKTWNDKEDQDGKRPGSITVNLLANGRQVQSKEVSATDGWKYEFGDLAKYENGQEITYTVTEDQVPGYNTEIKGFDIINSYTPGKTSVSVTKVWEDSNDQDGLRPNSVKVQLYANGEKIEEAVELSEGNTWRTTWNDLPEKANGETIVYTVKEVSQVPGYTSQVDDSDLGNVKITNTHTPERIKVSGQKTWNDKEDQDGKRPGSITVNLLANGRQVQSKEVSATDGWKYEFGDLAKYENGQEITYTVTEDQVPGYNTEIKGFDIINSYTPGKTSVSVTKAWEDSNDQDGLRPNSVKVQLYANGEKIEEAVELSEGNTWRTTWNDLPEKANGETIVYTVKEVSQVPGYTSQVDDSNLGNVKITNTHNVNKKIVSPNRKDTKNKVIDRSLPRTGSENSNMLLLVGILALILVLALVRWRRNCKK